jgi:large subunit ribosomal protein L20
MPRVKRGVTARARHKKVIDQAKGYRGRRNNVYRIAKEAVMKAGQYHTATAGRRSASFARCGSRASTRPCASSA